MKNIILHLPIKFDTNMVEKNDILEEEIMTYSPTITVPTPYEPDNNYQSIKY